MTIWMICPNAGSRVHGMNFRIYLYAREFVRLGHRVRVFSGTWSHQFVELPPATHTFNSEVLDGIDYTWVKVSPYGGSGTLARAWTWLQFLVRLFRFRPESVDIPDVVVVSSPVPYTILNGIFFSRKYRSKLVFEVRDLWPLSLSVLGGYRPWHPVIWVTAWFEKLAYQRSDAVVSVLARSKEHMSRRGLGFKPWIWIPNGIEASQDSSDRTALGVDVQAFRAEFPFLVAYAGSFNQSNAIGTLLDLIRSKKGGKLVGFLLFGPEGDLKSEMRVTLKRESLNHVLLLDAVPKSRVRDLLSICDAGFIGYASGEISQHGISPTKIFDYISAGLPVLLASSGDFGGFDSYPSVRKCIPGEVLSLESALNELLNEPKSLRTANASTSHQRLLKEFDIQVLAKTYELFLKDLLR